MFRAAVADPLFSLFFSSATDFQHFLMRLQSM
jgi:hypothetical protein